MTEYISPETLAVHAGRPPRDDPYHAHVAPIYQTSTFSFESVESGARAFAREEGGASHIYSRLNNPTGQALESAIAALEGRGVEAEVMALSFGSGMAAISTVMLAAAGGGRIVAQDALYGCTHDFLRDQAPGLGIQVTFVDTTSTEAVAEAIDTHDDVRMVFVETPANPTMRLCDLEAISGLAHQAGALLCADNTFATPYHQRPLVHGADLVVHSTTKYLNGHGTGVGGAAVGRDPELMDRIRTFRKNLGGIAGPFDCWLMLNGIRTLALRMERHAANAARIASWLDKHPAVLRVHYPGLASHPQHTLARRQMERGYGGMISFELDGGYDAGVRLMESVELCSLAVSLGTVDTLIQHPASMTHACIPEEQRRAAGISEGLVRLSVGIEHVDELIADLRRGLGHG